MKTRTLVLNLSLKLSLLALPLAAAGADGLVVKQADELWPQWQARIAIQTSETAPFGLSRLLDGAAASRSWQGGALLGDYYFARPSFGSFRASGGVMFGATGGAPLLASAANPHLGLMLQGTGFGPAPGSETAGTVPYLGVGFTSAAWRDVLSLSADLGWVAEQPSSAGAVGRALFGNTGRDNAWRELRLSPVLQLGLRYRF